MAARRKHIYEVFANVFDHNKDLPLTPEDEESELRNYIDTILDEAEKFPRMKEKRESKTRVSDKHRLCKQYPEAEKLFV